MIRRGTLLFIADAIPFHSTFSHSARRALAPIFQSTICHLHSRKPYCTALFYAVPRNLIFRLSSPPASPRRHVVTSARFLPFGVHPFGCLQLPNQIRNQRPEISRLFLRKYLQRPTPTYFLSLQPFRRPCLPPAQSTKKHIRDPLRQPSIHSLILSLSVPRWLRG